MVSSTKQNTPHARDLLVRKNYYFLVNDTRYDNHHGCLTVIKNLEMAMIERDWLCCGSLPVSSDVQALSRHQDAINKADLVIVNGEGSLHHDKRNANRLFDICCLLQETKPVVLINALWQENDPVKWTPILKHFKAIYVRDKQSLNMLEELSIVANYAPDLTFYSYPQISKQKTAHKNYGITDSVINKWAERALAYAKHNDNVDFLTMFTGRLTYRSGVKGHLKHFKYGLYPILSKTLGIPVPPRYKSLEYAVSDTHEFLRILKQYDAVCVARYHALCFVIQQEVPFVAIASNSHKSESLIAEIGLPVNLFMASPKEINDDKHTLSEKLEYSAIHFQEYRMKVKDFKHQAKLELDSMFTHITNV